MKKTNKVKALLSVMMVLGIMSLCMTDNQSVMYKALPIMLFGVAWRCQIIIEDHQREWETILNNSYDNLYSE